MEGMIAAAAWILACLVFSVWMIHLKNKKRLHCQSSHGPKIYPVVGTMLEVIRNSDRFLEWGTDYLQKAPGNTITLKKIGDKYTKFTANAATVEHILKNNFENYPKGDFVGSTMSDLLGLGIFNVDGAMWKIQRKLASYEFTTRSLQDYLMDSLADEVTNRLLPTVSEICEAGSRQIDLQDLFLRFAFDNVCKVAFGVDPKCLDPSFPMVKFAEAFDAATRLTMQRFRHLHPVLWKIKKVFRIGSEKKLREALVVVNDFAAMVISNRRKAMEDGTCEHNQDLLSRFMALQEQQIEQGATKKKSGSSTFSDKFLRDTIISFVLAGRDTTSVSLTWFFWLLSKHPEVEQKIIQEIHTVAFKSKDRVKINTSVVSSDDSSSTCEKEKKEGNLKACFTYSELREMHYLHAAISESLRLYPAVPFDTKVARSSDILPDGTRMEPGMRITYHIYAMGRMEKLWGKDCLEFRPERWLGSDGCFQSESPYKFPAFQAGPRVCLGKDMAMLQMKSVAAALIPRFRFVLLRPEEEPRYTLNMTLPMKHGLQVIPRRRTWT